MAEKSQKNRVISRKKFREFLESHPEHLKAKATFDLWYKTARRARRENFADVRETYGDASHVDKFVVFNAGGNKYRIIYELIYNKRRILIRHVLTHAEYDQNKWNT